MALKRFFVWFAAAAAAAAIAGCAAGPHGATGYPTITVGAARYLSLAELSDREKLAWDFDPLSQVLILKKEGTEARFLIGSRKTIVNDKVRDLSAPVIMRASVVWAPEEVLDIFVPRACPVPLPLAVPKEVFLRRIDRVVLDAGHGGKDPGASGRKGLKEKQVNLDMVWRIKRELEHCGLEVTLTRADDTFIPLAERPRIANDKSADLFVSLHANATLSRWVEGFEVYYLTEDVDDSARALAAIENVPAEVEEGAFHRQIAAFKAMLWDLIFTENRRESIELARMISKTVAQRLGMKLLGVKGAPFAVLKGARMPAVLVEVGYLSNRDGERKLNDPAYRQKMAEAVAAGILEFKAYAEGAQPAVDK
ncbi:MAG: N-acetylmuramoyl-L-alanine amidase [Deltaproteobacteria bacterium]